MTINVDKYLVLFAIYQSSHVNCHFLWFQVLSGPQIVLPPHRDHAGVLSEQQISATVSLSTPMTTDRLTTLDLPLHAGGMGHVSVHSQGLTRCLLPRYCFMGMEHKRTCTVLWYTCENADGNDKFVLSIAEAARSKVTARTPRLSPSMTFLTMCVPVVCQKSIPFFMCAVFRISEAAWWLENVCKKRASRVLLEI